MKHPRRFAISDGTLMHGTLRVTGSELHHMRDVMRLGPGAEIVLCSQDGTEYAGGIAAFEPNAAIITVAEGRRHDARKARRLILAAALIKAARMDLLVEKAAELDAAE